MDKILEYKILADTDIEDLENAVAKQIKNGWQPFGGVSMSFRWDNKGENDYGFFRYAQAMVKYQPWLEGLQVDIGTAFSSEKVLPFPKEKAV
jgi:hypothetical protein